MNLSSPKIKKINLFINDCIFQVSVPRRWLLFSDEAEIAQKMEELWLICVLISSSWSWRDPWMSNYFWTCRKEKNDKRTLNSATKKVFKSVRNANTFSRNTLMSEYVERFWFNKILNVLMSVLSCATCWQRLYSQNATRKESESIHTYFNLSTAKHISQLIAKREIWFIIFSNFSSISRILTW